MMLEILLPVEPIAKERARVSYHAASGKFKAYTPKKTKKAEENISFLVSHHMIKNGIKLSEGPLDVSIRFVFKSKALGDMWHTKKPDIDNCLKLVLDALNGIVYKDDSQIVRIEATKESSFWDAEAPYIFLTVKDATKHDK